MNKYWILWMGAASGSRTLVATVLSNSIRYNNLDVIETGYGISLRPLSVFANEVHKNCDTHCFHVKLTGDDADTCSEKDKLLSARMYKAITMILFKLEGQKVLRRPEFQMEDRALLHRINYAEKTITIGDVVYPLEDCDFPTVDPENPYELTAEENRVIDQLTESFRHSEKLQRHTRFLYSKGGLYKVHNGNLLLHSCVPMTEDGQLLPFTIGGKERSGREFMDYADRTARKAYYDKRGTPERVFGMDFLWWLWAGRNSPIFSRDRMTTFERRFIKDESTWMEPKNAYYSYYNDPAVCDMLLKEFGLEGPHCHIINGHVPVKARKGESPVKGGGKLLVIDGGFSRAYQKTSGIAGYTLLFSSRYFRIVSHQLFTICFKADGVYGGSKLDIAISGMSVKLTSDSEDEASMIVVNTDRAKGTVDVVVGISFSAVCLYTGDDVDLIPATKKAVAVAVTGIKNGTKLSYNDGTNQVEFKYSAEITAKTGVSTYVALVDAAIGMEHFINDLYYTIPGGDAAAVSFGDANGDGVLNAQDALAVVDAWLRKGEEPSDDQILTMNVNGDSRINTFDALGIVEAFVNGTEYGVVTKAATITTKQ